MKPHTPQSMAALSALQESQICTQWRFAFAGRAVMACAALGGARWRPLTAGLRQSGVPSPRARAELVHLDRAVDLPHEPPGREEAYGARAEEEEERDHHHVAEVEQDGHEAHHLELVRVRVEGGLASGSGSGSGLGLGMAR